MRPFCDKTIVYTPILPNSYTPRQSLLWLINRLPCPMMLWNRRRPPALLCKLYLNWKNSIVFFAFHFFIRIFAAEWMNSRYWAFGNLHQERRQRLDRRGEPRCPFAKKKTKSMRANRAPGIEHSKEPRWRAEIAIERVPGKLACWWPGMSDLKSRCGRTPKLI